MHGKNYRVIRGMAYTSKKFAPGAPNPKVARFTTGKSRTDYDFIFKLVSDGRVQIRHNALEAARVAASKKVALLGEENFLLRVVTYPHLILRENKMIATAGADRLQEGMRKAFGKPIGLAARVAIGSVVLELSVKSENYEKGKEAMWAAGTKLPMKTHVEIVQLSKPVAAEPQAAA
ncbi:MAG: 50S ribosomal protein L16 [Nitrososphaerota archaeon]|jgi:large subunit ribosomal protein L10e|nr:50S ribosomal protein L16 [Nitrososphaerota archaeon]MDG6956445.1 50S ribosomal protein L16 [Nitrososphaerota archaeon]MDG6957660.1 50S ribosomal protein L16 [Nitrososphaerota archaeon]MDG6958922.1 50S ribosomal protein L16 [Nitrososphaerota archaeon]MDG6960297.1 50S ribosomal protein L16 [Nitrososphaerota archaeon]